MSAWLWLLRAKKSSGESRIDDVPNIPQLSGVAIKPSEHVLTGLHCWICKRVQVCTLSGALKIPDVEGLKIIFYWYTIFLAHTFPWCTCITALHKTLCSHTKICVDLYGYAYFFGLFCATVYRGHCPIVTPIPHHNQCLDHLQLTPCLERDIMAHADVVSIVQIKWGKCHAFIGTLLTLAMKVSILCCYKMVVEMMTKTHYQLMITFTPCQCSPKEARIRTASWTVTAMMMTALVL